MFSSRLVEFRSNETVNTPKFSGGRIQVCFQNHKRLSVCIFKVKNANSGSLKRVTERIFRIGKFHRFRISMLKQIQIRFRIGINMILIHMRTLFSSFTHVKKNQAKPTDRLLLRNSEQLLKNPKLKTDSGYRLTRLRHHDQTDNNTRGRWISKAN